ncbi:hypothetical protein HS088_TW14G00559 [Tripterygium wilfordii]|uniref:Uncharacterized protein n=1 Tax=Tripterygium wilfordii TaxID=458696 RepID=A0A7J7CQQ3_TRIWF|nr:hypothetical protein HS088_TW14G00559 [Tripterygium wilfordii]
MLLKQLSFLHLCTWEICQFAVKLSSKGKEEYTLQLSFPCLCFFRYKSTATIKVVLLGLWPQDSIFLLAYLRVQAVWQTISKERRPFQHQLPWLMMAVSTCPFNLLC